MRTQFFLLTLKSALLVTFLMSSLQAAAHPGQEVNEFTAYAMAHKGKASSSVSYNPSDPPEAYTNATVHSRLSEYTEAGRSVHGPEWDPTRNELDTELVMRLGGGKKHGRYWIADSVIDTASTPTLFQIRAASTDGSVPIRQRTTPSQQRVEALEVISDPFFVHSYIPTYTDIYSLGAGVGSRSAVLGHRGPASCREGRAGGPG